MHQECQGGWLDMCVQNEAMLLKVVTNGSQQWMMVMTVTKRSTDDGRGGWPVYVCAK